MTYFVSIAACAGYSDGDMVADADSMHACLDLETRVHSATGLLPMLGNGRITHDEKIHSGWTDSGDQVFKTRPRLGYFVSSMVDAYAIIDIAGVDNQPFVSVLEKDTPPQSPMPTRFVAKNGTWSVPALFTAQGDAPSNHMTVLHIRTGNNVVGTVSVDTDAFL